MDGLMAHEISLAAANLFMYQSGSPKMIDYISSGASSSQSPIDSSAFQRRNNSKIV